MTSIPPKAESPPKRDGRELEAVPETIGGLLPREPTGELALGDDGDYGADLLEMGEADEEGSATFGLSFIDGGSDTTEVSASWDVSDVQDLVVRETGGDFKGDGEARNDVFIMEADFDPDDEVILAVWGTEGGGFSLAPRVRRPPDRTRELLPYAMIGAGLGAVGIVAVVVLSALAVASLFGGPTQVVAPLDKSRLPPIEVKERQPPKEQTVEEILDEILGEDREGRKKEE